MSDMYRLYIYRPKCFHLYRDFPYRQHTTQTNKYDCMFTVNLLKSSANKTSTCIFPTNTSLISDSQYLDLARVCKKKSALEQIKTYKNMNEQIYTRTKRRQQEAAVNFHLIGALVTASSLKPTTNRLYSITEDILNSRLN